MSNLHTPPGAGSRWTALVFGGVSYLVAFTSILYAMGFLADVVVPKAIDTATGVAGGWTALAINLALLGLFGLQHSVMARPAFKRMWTRIIPAHLERPAYVLASGLCLWALFAGWQPMNEVLWTAENPALRAVLHAGNGFGWCVMLLATFMINHFDLFGLEQAWTHFTGRRVVGSPFMLRGFYKVVRHPIQLGLLIAFWSTPDLTAGRLLFASVCTLYILVALQLEERDLLQEFGARYQRYREEVRMLLPLKRARSA